MSGEIPADDFRVIGLSKKTNARFWADADRFGIRCNQAMYAILLFTCLAMNSQLFLDRNEVNIFIYFLVQTLHSLHYYVPFYQLFHIFVTMNVFYLTMITFFHTKFGSIAKRTSKLKQSRSINRRMRRLIYELNSVILETFRINDYFKHLIGHNLFGFFTVTVLSSFAIFYLELRLKFLYTTVIFMYIIILGFPFKFASSLTGQVSRTFIIKTF